MTRADTTPFQDPRNAVGLLTAVLDLAIAAPEIQTSKDVNEEMMRPVHRASQLAHAFVKSPRTVLNGYRRSGYAKLYQSVKETREKLPEDLYTWNKKKVELYATIKSLCDRGLGLTQNMMEDADRWQKAVVEPRPDPAKPPLKSEWTLGYHDHVSSAARLGVDLSRVHEIEVEWRFRDLTDRGHRGRNIRAAFEAAWLSGNYAFAKQLLK